MRTQSLPMPYGPTGLIIILNVIQGVIFTFWIKSPYTDGVWTVILICYTFYAWKLLYTKHNVCLIECSQTYGVWWSKHDEGLENSNILCIKHNMMFEISNSLLCLDHQTSC